MQQSADFGDLDYNSRLGRLYCSRLRRILGKREMMPGAMIICEVTFQDAAQVPFPKDDDVIRALSTNRSDESFDIRTLPWAMGSRHHFLDLHPVHPPTELIAVDLVAISQEKARRSLFREGLDNLLCGPSSRRMPGHVEVNHSSAIMGKYDKHEQHAEGRCRNGEEIDRDHLAKVILEKGPPRLRRRLPTLGYQTRDCSLGNLNSEFLQFSM